MKQSITNDDQIDLFDLEQEILTCWNVTTDIATLVDRGADSQDFTAIKTLYDHKFEQLWELFERLCRNQTLLGRELPKILGREKD